jgi:hypothetical protein
VYIRTYAYGHPDTNSIVHTIYKHIEARKARAHSNLQMTSLLTTYTQTKSAAWKAY